MAVFVPALRPGAREPAPWGRIPGPLACAGIGLAGAVIVGVGAALGPLAGVAALIAVGVGLATLANPAIGALIIVAVAPATSGLARGLPVPGLRLSEVIAAGLGFLIFLTRRRRARVPWTAFEWAALAYVVATAGLGGFDLLSRGETLTSQDIGGLFGPLQFLILYLAVASAITTDALRRRAIALLLASSVPVSILALLQQANVAGARGLIAVLTGTDIYTVDATDTAGVARATGPFPHWHQLGAFLAIVILIAVGVLLDRRVKVLSPRVVTGILLLATIALVQTVTITAIVIALAGVLALGAWYGRLRTVLKVLIPLMLVASIAFAPLIVGRYQSQFAVTTGSARNTLVPSTIAYRYEVWTQQWFPLLDGRWLTGFGPDIPSTVAWPYPESLYLEMVLRGGLPLLFVLVALMVIWGARAGPLVASEDPTRRLLGRLTVYLMVSLGVAHIIVPYFVDSGTPHLLWALAGLTFGGLAARPRADRAPRALKRARSRLAAHA